jgi:hypothetical protein
LIQVIGSHRHEVQVLAGEHLLVAGVAAGGAAAHEGSGTAGNIRIGEGHDLDAGEIAEGGIETVTVVTATGVTYDSGAVGLWRRGRTWRS